MEISRALGDESRVRLVMALSGRELCVCQLIELLGLAPSTVSKHLQQLRGAGLVESSKRGRWIYYRRRGEDAPAAVRNAYSWLQHSLALDPQIRADAEQLSRVCCLDPGVLSRLQASSPDFSSGLTCAACDSPAGNPIRVLFLCTGNSARSQMAEAWLDCLGAGRFAAASAGTHPMGINPLTYEVMAESGFTLAGHESKDVKRYLSAEPFDYVITLCDDAEARGPVGFGGPAIRLHWSLPDPAACAGIPAEQLQLFRNIRDEIHTHVAEWIASLGQPVAQAPVT